jgi:hypothetical protein
MVRYFVASATPCPSLDKQLLNQRCFAIGVPFAVGSKFDRQVTLQGFILLCGIWVRPKEVPKKDVCFPKLTIQLH